eukprot:3497369-Lingulodinium_polyedra.AAC.1
MSRALLVLNRAFFNADVKAVCPSGHRLALAAATGRRVRRCANCGDQFVKHYVTCECGVFRACVRCALKVTLGPACA